MTGCANAKGCGRALIHKIMAGNLDMYVHCGNAQALEVAEKIAGWAAGYTQSMSYDHMQRVLGTVFDEVVSERSCCTGGTSSGESWNTDPGKLSTALSTNTTECCCAYNMMKLARHSFGWSAINL